jgi:hypothetical protein
LYRHASTGRTYTKRNAKYHRLEYPAPKRRIVIPNPSATLRVNSVRNQVGREEAVFEYWSGLAAFVSPMRQSTTATCILTAFGMTILLLGAVIGTYATLHQS